MADRRRQKPSKVRFSNSGKAKSAPKLNAGTVTPTPQATTSGAEGESSTNISGANDLQESFERELLWCIEQLEKGLVNQNKPDNKKANEAVKILKILQNPKTPLIKKRQAMRNTFGDYRMKMEAQMKQANAAYKKMKMDSVASDVHKKSTFLKKSTGSIRIHTSTVEMDFQKLDIGTGEDFKFNFQNTANEELCAKNGQDSMESNTICEAEPRGNAQVPLNYFRMPGTEQSSFKFNFECPDS